MCVFSQSFTFQNYSVSEDLSQSQVYSILEDSRGYLWLGTQGGGLDRFDGENFKNFSRKDGLKDIFINALAEDTNGNIWIGTNHGLWRFDGWDFKFFDLKRGNSEKILSLLIDRKGDLWIGTIKGFLKIESGKIIPFSDDNNLRRSEIYSIYEDSRGSIWVGSNFGVTKISGSRIQQFSSNTGMPGETVTAFSEDKNGRIWVGIFGVGIGTFVGDNCYLIKPKSGLKPLEIQTMEMGIDGAVWIGTFNQGLFIWSDQDSIFAQFSEKKGLAKKDVRAIEKDQWGNFWIGTSGGGISKYGGQQFIHYDQENGLEEEFIYALCEDDFGRIWFSNYDKGVSFFNGRFFEHLGQSSDSLKFVSKALFKDNNGDIWIGTEKKGLILYKDNQFTFLQNYFVDPAINIRDIIQDKANNIWVGTAGSGILKLNKDTSQNIGFRVQRFTKNNGLLSNQITNLHADTLNRIWYTTRKFGVGYLIDDQVVDHFSIQEGLVSREVKTMAEDSTGFLWFGTPLGLSKLFLYGDSLFLSEKENNQKLNYKNLYSIAFDAENNLWTGSQKGVEKSILDGGRNIIETKFYGKSEGFLGIETCQNSVWKDSEDNLWFGTMNGLTKYQSGTTVSNSIPPKLHFTDIRLFYKTLKKTPFSDFAKSWGVLEPGLILKHNQNHLNFKFLGVNLPNPEKVKYSWKLEGSDSGWSPPESQNEVMFPNLPPNKYTFKVKACNEDGVWSKEPLIAEFEILPPFWQTWWFRGLSLASILGLIIVVFKIRLNQVRTKSKLIKDQLEIEKKLLQLEQKALQLQMNPHFIFNALNSIQSLISQKDHKTARYHLAKFSKLMRHILENSRDQAISLEQEIETLKDYLSLEQFSRGNTFNFRINISSDIDVEEIFIPPMIIQPFVENAIIHGVAHLKKAGQIEINLIMVDNHLQCEITDNGIGREAAKRIKSQQEEQHKSMALTVTQERLEILGETNESSVFFEDICNDNGSISGTRVLIYLPISSII